MRSRAETKRILARSEFLQNLLAEFGVTLSAFDPGVAGYIKRDQAYVPVNFDFAEWAWLEPLLVELRKARHGR